MCVVEENRLFRKERCGVSRRDQWREPFHTQQTMLNSLTPIPSLSTPFPSSRSLFLLCRYRQTSVMSMSCGALTSSQCESSYPGRAWGGGPGGGGGRGIRPETRSSDTLGRSVSLSQQSPVFGFQSHAMHVGSAPHRLQQVGASATPVCSIPPEERREQLRASLTMKWGVLAQLGSTQNEKRRRELEVVVLEGGELGNCRSCRSKEVSEAAAVVPEQRSA